jgi:hypothetical protein
MVDRRGRGRHPWNYQNVVGSWLRTSERGRNAVPTPVSDAPRSSAASPAPAIVRIGFGLVAVLAVDVCLSRRSDFRDKNGLGDIVGVGVAVDVPNQRQEEDGRH